ncbi:MAG: hypothetical protein NT162_01640 [Candidatus Woesebacteria bacterium]|nr:hypothetical protein [Candidatus Woesebacteria bacterium]
MPNQDPTVSPFETVTSKKSVKANTRGIVITICIVVFLILGVVAGVLLVKQQQNISEKASGSICPAAAACPVSGQPTLLRNCNSGNTNGTPQEISCSNIGNVGQISACGTLSFCCPSLGASWTTDLTLCTVATASPTPTATVFATATPTATASATPTSTASASATPRARATPREIPVTGIDWPTILGAGVGAAAIIGAIFLAL